MMMAKKHQVISNNKIKNGMNVMNTLKNKAKFFALYWGQKVLHQNGYKHNPRYVNEHSFSSYHTGWAKEDYLLLKPLSSIRDQDIIENKEFLVTHISDYLRSKGYALPWNGISIEEQIEYGWIKLIENE